MTPFYADEWLTVLAGDCRTVLPTLPDASVDCVVTSPPYWMQRSYLPAEHELKGNEIGVEVQYQEWESTLVAVAHELRRILKPEGSLWIVLGDKYRANGGGYTWLAESGRHERSPGRFGKSWLYGYPEGTRRKTLLLAPYRFAIAMCNDGWVLRDEIIWHKTNAFPESVLDRFARRHEVMFRFTPNETAYFDMEAILEPYTEATIKRASQMGLDGQNGGPKQRWYENGRRHATALRRLPQIGGQKSAPDAPAGDGTSVARYVRSSEWKPSRNGANPGDVWPIAPASSAGRKFAHAAMFPSELIRRPILATCPRGGARPRPFRRHGHGGRDG